MKKKLFFLPFVAALALTGCSDDEPAMNGGVNEEGTTDGSRFMAVSIVSTPTFGGSRAAGEQYDPNNGSNKDFEDGIDDENKVTKIRFYFFNSVGGPAKVKGSTNFYDVDDITYGEQIHNQTIEKTINAIVIINPGEQLPAQVIAVLNPNLDASNGGLGDGSYTKPDLCDKIDNYADLANTGKQFVMINSVYADGQDAVVATTITPDKYADSEEGAKNNPVQIYVERNVAKVRTNVSTALSNDAVKLSNGDILYPVLKKENSTSTPADETKEVSTTDVPYTIDEGTTKKQVYVKFLGWDITATLPYAFLSKHINPLWVTNNPLGTSEWNAPRYHRSYWASLCDGGSKNKNQYFPYNDATKFTNTKFDGKEFKYCNENAERSNNGVETYLATKVIIKAQLCDETGKALNLCEYAGNRIIDTDNHSGLKARYLLMLRSAKANTYWKAEKAADGTTTYTEISENDIAFETATEKDNKTTPEDINEGNRFKVYPCLNESAKDSKYTWYAESSLNFATVDNKTVITVKDNATPATVEDIDNSLNALGYAKIWNNGDTYYYANIMHFGKIGTTDIAGVVRNHIYNLEFTKVYGLGTPVYKPGEVIVPEKPQRDNTYVAAQINILSWRYVPSSVVLDWND